jgi:hypothetical protein
MTAFAAHGPTISLPTVALNEFCQGYSAVKIKGIIRLAWLLGHGLGRRRKLDGYDYNNKGGKSVFRIKVGS